MVLVAVVIGYISFDASIGNAGLIQGNDISVFAFALVAIVVVTVFVMAKLLIGIVKRSGEGDEPMPELPVQTKLLKK